MNLEQLFFRYLDELQPGHSLREAHQGGQAKFLEFCESQEISRTNQVTGQVVRDFQQWLLWERGRRGQLYKPNTVDQFLRRVRQVLRWAHQRGFLESNPIQDLRLPRPIQPVREVLSWEELQAVLGAFDRSRVTGLRDAALYAVVTETELGVGDCLDLVVGQEQHLTLESATRALLIRYLEEARPHLATAPDETALFIGRGGRALGRQAAFLGLQRAARAAAVPGQVLARTLQRSYRAHFDRQAQQRHGSQDIH